MRRHRGVGACRAIVRHEQRVADKHSIFDLIGHVGGRMSWRVEDLDGEISKLEAFAAGKEMVELAAVAFQVGRVEHRAEDLLHVADVLANTDLGAGLELDIGRARQMIGMGVRLEHPLNGETVGGSGGENDVCGLGRGLAARMVVIEHRIDHRRSLRLGIGDEIAHGVGRLVEKGADR